MAQLPVWVDFVSRLRSMLAFGLIIVLCYVVNLIVYRLFFHPLAHLPGPKVAATSGLYEFYYNVIKRGRFTFEIKRLHGIYGLGPIIRIAPNEVHISDPDYYDVIYAGGSSKRDKEPRSANMFANPGSMLSTVPHDHHRVRRGALSGYFSKASVIKLEPLIKTNLEKLCARLKEFSGEKVAVNLDHVFTAFTTDLITEYAFGESHALMEEEDFRPSWSRTLRDSSEASLLHKQAPLLSLAIQSLPNQLQFVINDNVIREAARFQQLIGAQIQAILSNRNLNENRPERTSIFHEILDSNLAENEKTPSRLQDEAQTVVAAGSITVSHYLKAGTFHLLQNPQVLQRLNEELETFGEEHAWSDPWDPIPMEREFEKLPYLNMVVLEIFRLTYGVISRLPRVAPLEELQYKQYIIPRGTPVSMTAYIQHRDKRLFPDPDRFDPERFRPTVNGKGQLDRYLVNFSRGSRACLGMNLARHEIFLTLPTLVRRYMNYSTRKDGQRDANIKMMLYETDRSDVEIQHDFFNPYPKLDSKGVRVLIG